MTERTLAHPNPGPVVFDATTRSADIHVTTADIDHATVTIETTATTGPAHDAVQAADLTARTGYLGATLRDQNASGISIQGGNITISGNNFSSISTGFGSTDIRATGRVVVNGVDVTDAVNAGTADGANAPITVRATLPRGSSVDLRSDVGQITITGDTASTTARTVSGRIEVGYAQTANLGSISGSVSLDSAVSVQIQTVSGRIGVGKVGAINATTVSGRIEIDNTSGMAQLSTVSGRINAGYSGPAAPSTSSISGRVDTYRVHQGASR